MSKARSGVHFRDQLTYTNVPVLSDAQGYVHDLLKDSSKSLSLTVVSNATYSGYFLNGRVYPGKYVKAGTPTWVDSEHGGVSPYNAPVLKNHSDEGDPIGRVVHAEYRQLAQGDAWLEDWRKPASDLQKGSGFIRLTMSITDPLEIPKFMDGRHKTLSTTSVSKNLICSICGHDVMKDREWCNHRPGEEYEPEENSPLKGQDKALAYLITGPKVYKEVSVVWNPAQPHAVIDTIKGLSDALRDQKDLDTVPYLGTVDIAGSEFELIIRDDVSGAFVPLTRKAGQEDAIPNGSMRPKTLVAIPPSKPEATPNVTDNNKDGVAGDGSMDNTKLDQLTKAVETLTASLGVLQQEIQTMSQENPANGQPPVTPVTPPTPAGEQPGATKTEDRTVTALASTIADLKENNKQLQADRDSKEAELARILSENTSLKDQLHKERCLRLAYTRAVTVGSSEGKTLDSLDSVKAYAGELAQRAHVSIADSLKDEDAVFNAKLPHLKGLPNFISGLPKPEASVTTREVESEDNKNPTSKDRDADI